MARVIRLVRLACAIAVVSMLAGPAYAVRLCHNVCTCNASCALACRDDAFVPTTCGASIYDCIDKCIEIVPAQAAPVALVTDSQAALAGALEEATDPAACRPAPPLPLRFD